jgi:hypothetical protein
MRCGGVGVGVWEGVREDTWVLPYGREGKFQIIIIYIYALKLWGI